LEQIFRIQNHARHVPGLLDGVEEFCRVHGFARETTIDVRLVAEEVLTNVVKYAHEGAEEEHTVELRLSASSESIRMEFRDEGAPFNPLDVPVPDLNTRPEERQIGGLGIHLVRSLVDDASYSREGRVNVLILIKGFGSTV
jgi:anti-sigma regulatory factor (Ser/Thr protein kinase)